jgi:hypothetical protein
VLALASPQPVTEDATARLGKTPQSAAGDPIIAFAAKEPPGDVDARHPLVAIAMARFSGD